MQSARRVVIVMYPGVQPLDVVGPGEVFHAAARLDPPGYAVEFVAPEKGPVGSSTVGLVADRSLRGCRGPIDTLIVAGGTGVVDASADPATVSWLRSAAARSRRVCSVCSGAFLLAEAGLLDGRRATTHWAGCERLAELYDAITVERDPIFVRDEHVYTSAGVTAGMDLALALVEDDLGPEVALAVAQLLVVFLKRPGGQSQFSGVLSVQQASRPALRELQAWIAGHLDEDLSDAALAARAHLSERSFARALRAEVSKTPAVYAELLRVERARALLEDGAESTSALPRTASASGSPPERFEPAVPTP